MKHGAALSSAAAARIGILLAVMFVVLAAARFWLHDALPYLVDYTEGAYRRYWPNRQSLLVHIAAGTIALFAGPFQLWSGLRARYRRLHRWTGYAYVSAIAISASSSFFLAFHTTPDFGLALFILAIVWWVCIAMALVAVRNRRIDAHREWMIRSYIVTFSFVSYRFLVGLSMFKGLGAGRHATVLWISWVVPMLLFELFLQWDRVRPLKRRVAPATPAESVEHAWL
jgi:uncharacterized membrane protein